MNRERLSPTRLARQAQISRATVYVVLDSRSNQPGTMRQLARGIAVMTDRSGAEMIDPQLERAALRELLAAIGYERLLDEVSSPSPLDAILPEAAPDPRESARDLIRQAVGDDAATEMLKAADEGGLGPEGERTVAHLIRTLRENKRLREGR
jgi:hypothetical protein